MSTFDFYFWEPSRSPHKEDLFYELAKHPRVNSVVQLADSDISKERRALGWSRQHIDRITTVIAPTKAEIGAIICNSSEESIHIFSGMRWNPTIVDGLSAVLRKRRRFGFLSEPRVLEGPKGVLRLLHSWCTEGHFRRRASFVLAIGRNGPSWFSLAGFPQEAIFPFAYFMRDPGSVVAAARPDPVRVAYLGRMVRPKGFNLFLESLPHVKHPIRVGVAGAGSEQKQLADFISASDLPVEYLGALSIRDVHGFLSDVDILVVPSITKDDGWAAVVSEGLLAGAAVVATKQVGASICLENAFNGRLVASTNKQAVASAIDSVIADGLLSPEMRRKRSAWARERLTASAGAWHLVAIMDYVFGGGDSPAPFFL